MPAPFRSILTAAGLAMAMPGSVHADLRVDADFPGGNVLVDKIDGDLVLLRPDLRDTEGWWFYWCFRVRGAEGRTLTFQFTDREPIGVRGPAVSLDEGRSWSWLGAQPGNKEFSYTFAADAVDLRFSFGMTYTEAHLESFLSRFASHPALRLETLCESRKGRAVERLRLGRVDGQAEIRVLVTCRAHACEMMASYAAEGLMEAFLADDDAGNWFRKHVELLLVPFVDKDGVEEGDQGKNRRPRDHNRDYDAGSIYPETRALQDLIPQWSTGRLRVAIDLHCPSIRGPSNEVIYLVGSADPAMWEQQQRFGEILEEAQVGPLIYRTTDNLAFGQKWNTANNYRAGQSGARWAASLPGVKLAATIELPYANAGGREVNAETARAFGRDLARGLRQYLDSF